MSVLANKQNGGVASSVSRHITVRLGQDIIKTSSNKVVIINIVHIQQ
jgi:hypothetical protein